jgi:hypothetical protein
MPLNASDRKIEQSGVVCQTQPRPHQIFRRARASQFPKDGRKWRINQERDRRTARMVSHFDRGSGAWPALRTMLREMAAMEDRRTPGDRMGWSRATLCRSLQRLVSAGIVQGHEILRRPGGKWGSRKRSLHPERLLVRECETRWKPEHETQRFKSFAVHSSKPPSDAHDTPRPKTGRRAVRTDSEPQSVPQLQPETVPVEQAPKPRTPDDAFLTAFRVLAVEQRDATRAASLVMWIAYRALRAGKIPRSTRYYVKAAQAFEWQWQEHVGSALLEEAEGRFLKVCPRARPLVESIYSSEIHRDAQRTANVARGQTETPAPAHRDKPSQRSRADSWLRGRNQFDGGDFSSDEQRAYDLRTEIEMRAEIEVEEAARVKRERADLDARRLHAGRLCRARTNFERSAAVTDDAIVRVLGVPRPRGPLFVG